jgi:hypothetical protein
MNETDITITVFILLTIFAIIITSIFYKIPEKKCPECRPCPYFLDDYTPPQQKSLVNERPKREICRFNQDVKNNFSTFYKHNCGRTPYVKYIK